MCLSLHVLASKKDSLIRALPHITNDSILSHCYNDLSGYYWYQNIDSARYYAYKALTISRKNRNPWNFSAALNNLGAIYCIQSDFKKSIRYFQFGYQIDSLLHDSASISDDLNNMALIATYRSDYPGALQYHFKSLAISQGLRNKPNMGHSYNNIGVVYESLKEYKKAIIYYKKSLKIRKEIDDPKGEALEYSNIGDIYAYQKDWVNALKYYRKSLIIRKKINDIRELADSYTNMGEALNKLFTSKHIDWNLLKKQFQISKEHILDSAFAFHQKALNIGKQFDDEYEMIYAYSGMGDVCMNKKEWKVARKYYQTSVQLAEKLDAKSEALNAYLGLSESDAKTGNPDSALAYYRKYSELKDTLFSHDKSMEIGKLEAGFNYKKKILEQKKEQERKDLLNQEKSEQQQIIIYAILAILALLTVFFILIFNRFKITKRQKNIIEKQKQVVDHAYMQLDTKNKEITDSIHYAKRIQDALLKEEKHVSQHLPSHFVLFKPKDIVSGDFYWATEKKSGKDRYWYICVADCTGHGVPGAFMSMLGIAFLNEILAVDELLAPATILDKLREKIISELSQTGKSGETKDGMDISLIRINLHSLELQWAGANNPLWAICPPEHQVIEQVPANDGKPLARQTSYEELLLTELLPDKQPIGYHPDPTPFYNHSIQLQKGDNVYIFSDGFADQFGGEQGKKFKYKPFKKLLSTLYNKPMEEQKSAIDQVFEDWKGDLEQIDDVCIIGVRI